jgi:hypothetical protein
MIYSDYEKASLKHLKACKTMVFTLLHHSASISQKDKSYLLMNIFYLSGYTLECIINYALFKEVYRRNRWSNKECVKKGFSHKKGVVDKNLSFAFWQEKTPSFNPKTGKNSMTNKYNHCIQHHDFWNNVTLLDNLLSGNCIPLIGNKKAVPQNVLRIIPTWRAASRYDTHVTYKESDIVDLVDLTEKVYQGIINHVGI